MNSNRKSAIIAGASLVLMAICAGYSYGYVQSSILVQNNPTETLNNLQLGKSEFISGIIGWVLIFILDLVVAWTLYQLLKAVNKSLSTITATLRVVYTAFLGFAIWQLIQILQLIESEPSDLIMVQFESFETIWSIGLIIFGGHLLALGILVLKARNISRFWGLFLGFAGMSYFGIHLAKNLLTNNMEIILQAEIILSLPMALAELGFALWLILKGGKRSHLSSIS